jgi:hypothetical protein
MTSGKRCFFRTCRRHKTIIFRCSTCGNCARRSFVLCAPGSGWRRARGERRRRPGPGPACGRPRQVCEVGQSVGHAGEAPRAAQGRAGVCVGRGGATREANRAGEGLVTRREGAARLANLCQGAVRSRGARHNPFRASPLMQGRVEPGPARRTLALVSRVYMLAVLRCKGTSHPQ